MIRAALGQVQLAVMLLTRLPAGRLPEPAPSMGASAWAFPLAGLAVGAIAAAVLSGAMALGLPPMLAAGLALAAQIAATGALHEDGLADVCDGFWGGHDPARRLEIMRDSRIGSYGTLGLILSVGLRWQALSLLATTAHPWLAIIAVAMTSRVASAALLAAMPPARSDGLGRAASGVTARAAIIAAVIAVLPALAVPGMGAAIAVQIVLGLSLAALARRKIGGQTGDVLGTAQQLAEIGALLTIAARA
ncbi:adenosylcobinamide-GDP ribazoletransferase [Sedimentimonas flavescens]|uniref:Adenosylcobinamide-GDP ribazoletransferase n=1 Tax=Sedimentimonas flavescens TaxID=2851012 RepID=A0ABT3A1A7_9RHOB|nr:adenosylcobinamide-GDP ribazoletransferase [Sedimentimonas flavescens]MCV2879784.1 adenosylcobinamide-GDP ribazoletransferase [Sedimentimonas flavescens]